MQCLVVGNLGYNPRGVLSTSNPSNNTAAQNTYMSPILVSVTVQTTASAALAVTAFIGSTSSPATIVSLQKNVVAGTGNLATVTFTVPLAYYWKVTFQTSNTVIYTSIVALDG